jgi:sulfonate transport system permease protein
MTDIITDTPGGARTVRAGREKPGAAGDARGATTREHRRRLGPGRRIPGSRLLGPALLLAVWSAGSASGLLDPRILSAPWQVFTAAEHLIAQGELQTNLLISVQRAATGLVVGVVAGSLFAVVAGLSRVGESLVDGTMQVQRAIPALALLPLMILWLGIGEPMKIVLIALGVTISIYINTFAALTGIDSRYVELAEILELSRWQFIRKVIVPGTLPGFFVGLRLGVTTSWLALIVVEQINATSGIGYMMFQAQQYAQTDVIIVGLLVYGIFGFASDAAVRLVERRVLSWRQTLTG